ncbi:MAG: hypothetical protein M3076_02740 [Actinomycetota bacterium]|nr:hypothetical protein [Actinomycetota bacterium]
MISAFRVTMRSSLTAQGCPLPSTKEALWLVLGTPAEAANTLQMSREQLTQLYSRRA